MRVSVQAGRVQVAPRCRGQRAVCQVQCSLTSTIDGARTALPAARRDVLLGLATLLGSTVAPPAAQASYVDWWKERRVANSYKLIAPIKVAQQRLEKATAMLANGGSMTDVLQLVRSSSLNCYLYEALPTDSLETRASLFTQVNRISDPCTFRIIIKNAIDFASEQDKERGTALLNNIILSYQLLDSELEAAVQSGGGAEDNAAVASKATRQLAATLQLAYDMEGFVKEVLV